MNRIRTYEDLTAFRDSRRSALLVQRKQIDLQLLALRKEWEPLAGIATGISRVVTQFKQHPLLSVGIGLVGETLLASSGTTGRWFIQSAIKHLAGARSTQTGVLGSAISWVSKLLTRGKG